MKVETAKVETLASECLFDQCIRSVAAEAELHYAAAGHGPLQELGTVTAQGPLQMLLSVDAVDREVVEGVEAQPVEDFVELLLTFHQAQTRQELAGRHPSTFGKGGTVLECFSEKLLRRSVGGGSF